MSLPTYELDYDFQKASKEYILANDRQKLIDNLGSLMKAVCSDLYRTNPDNPVVDIGTLTSLSGLSAEELLKIDSKQIYEQFKNNDDNFLTNLLSKINIVSNGFYDGYEWCYLHHMLNLCSKEELLTKPSTSFFYEYMLNVRNPFSELEDCKNATTLLAELYPRGYRGIYNVLLENLLSVKKPDTYWAKYCESLRVVISIRRKPRGRNLLEYLVLVSRGTLSTRRFILT